MIPLRIIALLLGLFIFVGSAAELPPQVKELSDGNFYIGVIKNGEHEIPDPKEEVPDLAKGAYLDRYFFYRIHLKEDAVFLFKGGEAFVAAGKITKD